MAGAVVTVTAGLTYGMFEAGFGRTGPIGPIAGEALLGPELVIERSLAPILWDLVESEKDLDLFFHYGKDY